MHFGRLRKNKHTNFRLQWDYNWYEEENFIFEVIEKELFDLTESDLTENTDESFEARKTLLAMEQFYIDKYRSWDEWYGYNVDRVRVNRELGEGHIEF